MYLPYFRCFVASILVMYPFGLCGCGTRTSAKQGSEWHPLTKQLKELLPPPTVWYEGLQADGWGAKLEDASVETAREACQALRGLREEGFPYLVNALQNPLPHVREEALVELNDEFVHRYKDLVLPILEGLLADPAPELRRRAANKLARNRFTEVLPAMQAAATTETDPETKELLQATARFLQAVVRENLTAPK